MDIVRKLQQQDESALLEVMNQYGDDLKRTAYLLVKDHQTAEEAVQDAFLIAFKKVDQLDEAKKLKSWLTSIVVNQCRMRMRTWNWRNIIPFVDTLFDQTQDDATSDEPEATLLALLQHQELSKHMHMLDYKYREAIILFYFNEYSIKEIARITKTKENTVKSQLKRGRAYLKKSLTKGGGRTWKSTGKT